MIDPEMDPTWTAENTVDTEILLSIDQKGSKK